KARFVGQGVDAAVHGKTTGHAHLGVHGVHKAVAVRLSDVLLGSDQTHTGGNGYLGLQHAAHHALYMVRLGNGVDLFRRVQAAALHQLDVDDVCGIDLAGFRCVNGRVDRLVQHDFQVHLGTHKAHTVQIPAGQALIHRFHAHLFKGFQSAHSIADSVTLV